jgi:hypothetical protein
MNLFISVDVYTCIDRYMHICMHMYIDISMTTYMHT